MEPFKDTRRNRLIIVFGLVILLTTVYAGITMVGYSRFFPAMNRIEVKVSSMSWHLFTPNPTQAFLEINASFTVLNPENYGLTLKTFETGLDVSSPSQNTTVHQGTLLFIGVGRALTPENPAEIVVPSFNATFDAAQLARNTDDLQFSFTVDLVLRSFLDRVGELGVTHVCQTASGPVTCQLAALIISTKPGVSVGGGEE